MTGWRPWWVLLPVLMTGVCAAAPPEQVFEQRAYTLSVQFGQTSCGHPPGLPIAPRDPGTVGTTDGAGCADAGPQLMLRVPLERDVWLQPGAEPAAIVATRPQSAGVTPDGAATVRLRLSEAGGILALEASVDDAATLTALPLGVWKPVTAPDGQRFRVRADR